jgi:hypothetical protein
VDRNVKEVHAPAYGINTNWHVDLGARDHITGALNKLAVDDKYNGCDRVHTADGNGMYISHIGHLVLYAPSSRLHLKNILHVPSASKNLLSIHRLTLDNHVFLEFHPFLFFIKDPVTRRTLFKCPCPSGLYPLMPFSTGSSKQVFSTIKLSSSTWHRRLGHPSSFVVQQIIRKTKLSHSIEINPYVCDSCQLTKSH